MRTDRTYFCRTCNIRILPANWCSGCGGELLDLSQFEGVVVDPRTAPDRATPLFLASIGAVAFAGAMLFIGLVPFTLLFGALGAAGLWRATSPPRSTRVTLRDPPPRLEGAQRRSGTVHALDAPLRAPISGRPCVAFRLRGEGREGPIDDAMATRFGLGDGCRVEARNGSFDLSASTPMIGELRGDHPELGRWLRARLVLRSEVVRFTEEILAEGDVVEVFGAAAGTLESGGYRDGPGREELAERDGVSLVVRRL